MERGIKLFELERLSQINKNGYDPEHQRNHPEWYQNGQLLEASIKLSSDGGFIGLGSIITPPLNWDADKWSKLVTKPLKERLVIAGALLAAHYDWLFVDNEPLKEYVVFYRKPKTHPKTLNRLCKDDHLSYKRAMANEGHTLEFRYKAVDDSEAVFYATLKLPKICVITGVLLAEEWDQLDEI